MKNLTIEDIRKILKEIYKAAHSQEDCETCPFYNAEEDACICEDSLPCRWEDNI